MVLWRRKTGYFLAVFAVTLLNCCRLGLSLEVDSSGAAKERSQENRQALPSTDVTSLATPFPAASSTGTPRIKRKRPLNEIPVNRRLPTTLEHLVAGTLGGVSGVLASYPLDTLRIRMQTGGKHSRSLRVFSDILRESGVSGIYRGIVSPIVGAAFIKGAVFGGYGLFQNILRRLTAKDGQDLTLWALGVAAMGSGFVGAIIITPVERIKVFMQAIPFQAAHPNPLTGFFSRGTMRGGSRRYANVWSCARGLVADQGIWNGLYFGLGPTLLRVVPGYAAYFATYEAIKRFLRWRASKSGSTVTPSPAMVMLRTATSGAIAGIAAWLPVYPVDVVKSRMQSAEAGGPGMRGTAGDLYRAEGISPFFRGLVPTLGRAVVNHAATFVVYEAAMGYALRDKDE